MKKLMITVFSAAILCATVGSVEAKSPRKTETIHQEHCGVCNQEHRHCRCKTLKPDCLEERIVKTHKKPHLQTKIICRAHCPEGYDEEMVQAASCADECPILKCTKNVVSQKCAPQINIQERHHLYTCPTGTQPVSKKMVDSARINAALAAGKQPEIANENENIASMQDEGRKKHKGFQGFHKRNKKALEIGGA